jgi:hypothetical protein
LPIKERVGLLRYFYRNDNDEITWADTKEEIIEQVPHLRPDDILSVTFIPATLDDNPALTAKDPGYRAKLMSLSKVERGRLLDGNWRVTDGAIIEPDWLEHRFTIKDNQYEFLYQGQLYRVPLSRCRRIATIDTAGTSKEKAAAQRGDPPSNSACAIWDHLPNFTFTHEGQKVTLRNLLFLRYCWAKQVDWPQLKVVIPELLEQWSVMKAYIENAHHGQPLAHEIKCCQKELIGPVIPGMGDSSEGAKLERAIASGALNRLEMGMVLLPYENETWTREYIRELTTWTGLPKQPADMIDVTSYACFVGKSTSSSWGGTI